MYLQKSMMTKVRSWTVRARDHVVDGMKTATEMKRTMMMAMLIKGDNDDVGNNHLDGDHDDDEDDSDSTSYV